MKISLYYEQNSVRKLGCLEMMVSYSYTPTLNTLTRHRQKWELQASLTTLTVRINKQTKTHSFSRCADERVILAMAEPSVSSSFFPSNQWSVWLTPESMRGTARGQDFYSNGDPSTWEKKPEEGRLFSIFTVKYDCEDEGGGNVYKILSTVTGT